MYLKNYLLHLKVSQQPLKKLKPGTSINTLEIGLIIARKMKRKTLSQKKLLKIWTVLNRHGKLRKCSWNGGPQEVHPSWK